MTKYFEHDRKLYVFNAGPGDCDGCAFFPGGVGTPACEDSQNVQSCVDPNGHWYLVGEKLGPPATKCGKCEHQSVAGDQEPCKSCAFDPEVPKGYYPKFEEARFTAAPAGPVTVQLQAARAAVARSPADAYEPRLPEIPDGPGWTDHKGGMMPCSYHQDVDVQFRDGGGGTILAGNADWGHKGDDTDIVRWRPVRPARNGRETKVIPITPVEAAAQATALNQEMGLYEGSPSELDIDPTTAPSYQLNAKPTNPKDVIGVRKVPMSCVPAGVMMDVALALSEGAAKYGRHNYRGVGVRASVYYDAGIGHLMDWWEGDDIDSDSGLSHVTKAIASLVVLRDAMLQGKLTDDRPPRSKVYKRDFNDMAGRILDRHADKAPKHWTIADSESPTAAHGLSGLSK